MVEGKTDQYLEPIRQETAEIKVKGSRFIARIVLVLSQAEAEAAIRSVRKEHYDATHNCTAYRIGVEGEVARFSDDGEPSGTAGMPILRQIEGSGLTNSLVVVTRYYGGTKLGTGGLARAYGDAAAAAIALAGRVVRTVRREVRVTFDYADTSPAMHTIGKFDIRILESRYGDRTELRLGVKASQVAGFEQTFVEALAGRCEVGSLKAGTG